MDNRVDPVAQLADEAIAAAAEPDTTVRKTDQVKAENGRKSANVRDGVKSADKAPAAESAASESAASDSAASDSAADSASTPGVEPAPGAGAPSSPSSGATPPPVGKASESETTRPRFVGNSLASGKATPPPVTDAAVPGGAPPLASTDDEEPDSPAKLAAAALAADASSKSLSSSGSPGSGYSGSGYSSSDYSGSDYSGSGSSSVGSNAGTPSWSSSAATQAAAGKPAYSAAEPQNTEADPAPSARGFANTSQVTGHFSDPGPAPTPSTSVRSNGLKSKITVPFAIPTKRKPKPGRTGRQGSAINTGKTATVSSKPGTERRPPAQLSPDGSRPEQREARRDAQLVVSRIEPWSVMKFSFMVSLVGWVILFVAVAVLYFLLSSLGVFHAIENTIGLVTSTKTSSGSNASSWFSASTVLGYTMLAGAINVVLITALSTLGAVIYNVVTRLAGGVEVTLAEAD